MIGLDLMAAGLLTLASAGPVTCVPDATPPAFNITATGMEYVVDHTKSIKELTAMSDGTYSPYNKSVQTFTEGLMRGSISASTSFGWGISTAAPMAGTCLFVRTIDVKLHIDPTIYIAKEYKRGTCMYDSVMEHEMKHINVDRQIVNKYTYIIIKALDNTFKKIGYVHGPVNQADQKALETQIGGIAIGVVQKFNDNMNAERDRLQQKVDTVAEYARVDAQCKNRP